MTTVRITDTADALWTRTLTDGGATVNAVHPDKPAPTVGYAVSLAGHERTIVPPKDGETTVYAQILAYVQDKRALLACQGNYAGAWQGLCGELVLDITRVLGDKDDAIAFGRINGQTAIFDLGHHPNLSGEIYLADLRSEEDDELEEDD